MLLLKVLCFLDALASLDFKLSVTEWFTFFTASASTGLSELFITLKKLAWNYTPIHDDVFDAIAVSSWTITSTCLYSWGTIFEGKACHTFTIKDLLAPKNDVTTNQVHCRPPRIFTLDPNLKVSAEKTSLHPCEGLVWSRGFPGAFQD